MTAGVIAGYAEVARMIARLTEALKNNDATQEEIADLLTRLARSHRGTALFADTEEGGGEVESKAGGDVESKTDETGGSATPSRPVGAPAEVDDGATPIVTGNRGHRARRRALPSADRGRTLRSHPQNAADAMLNALDDPEMTNGPSVYAALIGLILGQGLELRSSLPHDEAANLATFTTELTRHFSQVFGVIMQQLRPWQISGT
jgi:hypothetical protein